MAAESEPDKGPTPKEWLRISGLVEAALELDRPLRGAWLQSLRRRSPELVDRVTVILAELESGQGGDGQGGDAASIIVDASRIGAYRLVGLLGRGGMGEVHLAERVDREFEHQVAIKLISAHEDAPLVQQRFLSERQILARLSHPNISRLYEGGTSLDGRPYFVLEYVQGEPIDSYCEQKGLDLDARLALFLEVCGAVEYAHRNLVVHRDLKPANILVDRDGKPKLLDFGIAKLLDPSSMPFALAATLTRQRPMTPAYATATIGRRKAASSRSAPTSISGRARARIPPKPFSSPAIWQRSNTRSATPKGRSPSTGNPCAFSRPPHTRTIRAWRSPTTASAARCR